jgi:hypothetical protein
MEASMETVSNAGPATLQESGTLTTPGEATTEASLAVNSARSQAKPRTPRDGSFVNQVQILIDVPMIPLNPQPSENKDGVKLSVTNLGIIEITNGIIISAKIRIEEGGDVDFASFWRGGVDAQDELFETLQKRLAARYPEAEIIAHHFEPGSIIFLVTLFIHSALPSFIAAHQSLAKIAAIIEEHGRQRAKDALAEHLILPAVAVMGGWLVTRFRRRKPRFA